MLLYILIEFIDSVDVSEARAVLCVAWLLSSSICVCVALYFLIKES